VTYAAGFTTIPPNIQLAAAYLVKWKLELAKQELLLASEKAADYSYTLAQDMADAMPRPVRQMISSYRLHYA